MKNSITFLGTGGSRYAMAYQTLATGGIIIDADGTQIHIDPGPGSLVRAKQFGVDATKTKIILVSHEHLDHANDLNVVVDAMTKGGFAKKGILITTKAVVEQMLTKYHAECLDEVVVLEPGKSKDIDKIKITATKTKDHADGIGFRIQTNKFTIGYTGDTGYFAELPKQFENCDILIVNNQRSFEKPMKDRLSSAETVKLIEKAKPKLTIITGFGMTVIKADPIKEARKIEKETGMQVIAATDGLVIQPAAYSAESKQQRLSEF